MVARVGAHCTCGTLLDDVVSVALGEADEAMLISGRGKETCSHRVHTCFALVKHIFPASFNWRICQQREVACDCCCWAEYGSGVLSRCAKFVVAATAW